MMFALTALALSTAQPDAGTRCASAGEASRLLAQADMALKRRDPRRANTALETGLRALGTAYRQDAMLDDTGMHLVLARNEERRGRITRAATLKRRVLAERLTLCAAPPVGSPR